MTADVIPQKLNKIRSELNLEKWTIWQPTNSRNQAEVKILQRKVELPDGSQLSAKVEVLYTTKGVLTTEDQKVYYALIKIWEENGRSMEQTHFSLRAIARILNKTWGPNTIKCIEQALIRLRVTSFIWENSYYDNSSKETFELLEAFNILADLKIGRKKKGNSIKEEEGYFKFNDLILKNLTAGYTKPTLIEVVIGFHSEIAQLLYTRIDLILADKYHYERRSKELFEELGLHSKSYARPGKRKQMLERALAELQGNELSTGVIRSATLEKTTDGQDYKIVIRKSHKKSTTAKKITPAPLMAQAQTLLSHFYKRFHQLENVEYTAQDIEQALSWIEHYNFDNARYIIDYSYQAALHSHYLPQTLNGLRQYTNKALAQLTTVQQQTTAHNQIQSCSLCDDNGLVTLQDSRGRIFTTKCVHDQKRMEEIESKRNLKRMILK